MACDEEKPKCRSCTRRATPCTYTNSVGLNHLAKAAQASSPYSKPEPGSGFPPVPYNHDGFVLNGNNAVQANSPLPLAPPSPLALNMPHLELLHHFIAVTSEVLGVETISRQVWKSTIPQIALSHDFLMHSILAVAALHIAHLRPEQRRSYWERTAMHQDRALELQQEAMANASRDNADALFSFSLLVVYYAFASPKVSGSQEAEEPLAGAIQCISIIRGMRYLLPPIRQWVEEGPLAQLLSIHPGNMKSNHSFKDHDTELYFQRFLVLCSTSSDMNKTHEFEDIEQCAAAASTLRASFLTAESVADGGLKAPPIWHWACRLAPEFLQRLGKLHPIPLVLVAHWCVILAQVRQYWWIQGWVDHTMGQIQKTLPREYHEWLDWPMKKVQEQRENWSREGERIGSS
ncbi:MAG: hypothetical protein ALECFALPRED_007974 [Alectoria fallacina]|uniref:Zn(2)-C6 fungal-type domain-containing protein n=1 Tax=Alectoria fallacina TaxID=1903189 RepID=A0A8H3PEU4_9LECA|nr:MAG: hypothetical protein ALECFALPRED_007974 [Alectoria fallacina]